MRGQKITIPTVRALDGPVVKVLIRGSLFIEVPANISAEEKEARRQRFIDKLDSKTLCTGNYKGPNKKSKTMSNENLNKAPLMGYAEQQPSDMPELSGIDIGQISTQITSPIGKEAAYMLPLEQPEDLSNM
jgi:hypothetical protein